MMFTVRVVLRCGELQEWSGVEWSGVEWQVGGRVVAESFGQGICVSLRVLIIVAVAHILRKLEDA